MDTVIANIEAEREFLASIAPEMLNNVLSLMLVMAATCLKHPGFMEEDEWRLIYLPSAWPSELVREETVEIRKDQPERVCKISFGAFEAAGIASMDLNTLIDRIIVGPSEFPDEIKRYIVDALGAADVHDPVQRVLSSGIPFRHSTSGCVVNSADGRNDRKCDPI